MRRAICGLLVLSVVSAQTWLEWSAWNGDCKVGGAVGVFDDTLLDIIEW